MKLLHGDCLKVLRTLPDESFDSCVTDPPYGLKFMGKKWDYSVPSVDLWKEVLRVLKPGAWLLAFGGSRTYHRMTVNIEDAGFEIRDQIMWVYGSGFPKSLDVSKAIDKAAGAERKAVGLAADFARDGAKRKTDGSHVRPTLQVANGDRWSQPITAPATDAARKWEGWGTALKPAFECLCCAQKPLTNEQHINIIGSNITRLEARLWSLLSASVAEKNFRLSRNEYNAACDFAQWSAEERSNTQAGLSALMDTSRFESVMITSLNIVCSWRSIWGDLWNDGSTSITGTATRPTIDLKTLNSCLLALTPLDIIRAAMIPDGLIAHASPAAKYFSGEMLRLSGILSLSAQGSATSNPPTFSPDADAKPYSRPICVARKPFKGTVADNVLKHGTGAMNVDGCRVGGETITIRGDGNVWVAAGREGRAARHFTREGRWPANFIHDGSDEVVAVFPNTTSGGGNKRQRKPSTFNASLGRDESVYGPSIGGDSGSAARFFYCAKASRSERGDGNNHPTVKPLALMEYLCRLVTPPGGTVLDPFCGSGTTLFGAENEGFKAVGIDKEADTAERRIYNTAPLFMEAL